jgi:hypothetical protein
MRWIIRSLLIAIVLTCAVPVHAAEGVDITPDVVYGHKHGMALTFDVFKPTEKANGVGILFIVSGGWYSGWRPPEKSVGWFKPMLDKGFTVFAVRHGSSPKYAIPEIIEDVRRTAQRAFHPIAGEKVRRRPRPIGCYRRQRRRAPVTDARNRFRQRQSRFGR